MTDAATRELLGRVLERLVEQNKAWTAHAHRFHEGRLNRHGRPLPLPAAWWDCLPHFGAYGDGLIQEIEDVLGVPEAERVG